VPELLIELIVQTFVSLLLVFPLWRIFNRAGKNPALSLFILIPYIGFLIVPLILAFTRWPATEAIEEDVN
jgi:hypothetical protein